MDRQQLDQRLREILDGVRQRIVEGASPSLQDLAQVEDVICDALNRSKADALQAWCDQAADDSASPACPHCGRRMRNKGRAGKTVVAEGGAVRLTRTRWWCDACKASFFPSGQRRDRGQLPDDPPGGKDRRRGGD